jgi:twitching motility protein PilT
LVRKNKSRKESGKINKDFLDELVSDKSTSPADEGSGEVVTVTVSENNRLVIPEGFDEEDFRETIEVTLPVIMPTKEIKPGRHLETRLIDGQIGQISMKLHELIEDREEVFRRVSLSVGDSQLALRNSDHSLKEVRALKLETEVLLGEMKGHFEHFKGDIYSRLKETDKSKKFEKTCVDLSDRLSRLEDLSDRQDEKEEKFGELVDELKEQLYMLKEQIDETTGKADTALEREEKLRVWIDTIESLKEKINLVETTIENQIEASFVKVRKEIEKTQSEEIRKIEKTLEQIRETIDEKTGFSIEQQEKTRETLTQNLSGLETQLKQTRSELGKQIHDINEQLGFNFIKRMSALENHLEMTSLSILPTLNEMQKKYDEKLLKLQETVDRQKIEIERLSNSLKESLDFEGIIVKRLETAEKRLEKSEARMQAEIKQLAGPVREQLAKLEKSQRLAEENIRHLVEVEKINELHRDLVDSLADKVREVSGRVTGIVNDQIFRIEQTVKDLNESLDRKIRNRLEPVETQLKDISGDLDFKLEPVRQEIAKAKSFIEEEMIKVKESWEKLDNTISTSGGAMDIAVKARESLERLDSEVKEAIIKLDGLMTSIRENTLKTDANSDKINLTIKMVDDARDRIRGIQFPVSSLVEDTILSQSDINRDPDLSDVGYILDDLLAVMMKHRGSDLHLKAGAAPTIRLNGELVPVGNKILTEEGCKKLVLSSMTPPQRRLLAAKQEVDYAYSTGEARFRVNAFLQKQSISAAFRMLWTDIPSMEELFIPPVIKDLCSHHHGLILVTGPAGSGKSTTLASMINFMNQTQKRHIITVEDPIEFLHRDRLSIITQREVGSDTDSFGIALRQALRQDPNVILIGEMRDPETIMTAAIAAETGHLVLSTLHTINTIQAVSRIIDVFSGDVQNQFRMLLANTLRGIISQRLLARADGKGRVPAIEVLVATPTVTSLILEERTGEIYDLLVQGEIVGMQTFTKSLLKLHDQGLITKEEALYHADQPTEFRMALEGHTSGGVSVEDDNSLMSWM